MLKFKQEQWDALEERLAFDRLCMAVCRAWPELSASLGPEETVGWIRRILAQASESGFSLPAQQRRFVHLGFSLGREDFASAPETSWAGDVLAWTRATPEAKLNALEELANQQRLAADRAFP